MKKLTLLFCLFLATQVYSQITFTATAFSPTFTTNPVGIVQAPGDDRLYIVLRNGIIRIVNTDGTLVPGNWLDISARVFDNNNEQGLLGLAFDPDYQNNGEFYVHYIIDSAGSSVDEDQRISRFRRSTIDPTIADPNSEEKLICLVDPYWNHNGGGLNFGPDGYLYCGMGDGGSGGDPGNRAQNTNVIFGKLLRINVSGGLATYTSPVSNPFYGMAGYRNELWTLGMRNPWRFYFDRITGDLWVGDVGQDAYEEIDHAERVLSDGGENYGWRCYEGNNPYNLSGCGPISNYFFPKAEIPQSTGPMCSITMGEIYRGATMGAIYDKMIFSDYCNDYIWTLDYDTTGAGTYDTTRCNGLTGANYNIVAFAQDRVGNMYFSTLHNNRIYKLGINTCTPAAVIEGPSVICSGDSIRLTSAPGLGLTYQWYFNGVPIPGAAGGNDSTIMTNVAGDYTLEVTNSSCGVNPTAMSSVLTVTTGTTPTVTLNSTTNDSVCLTGGNLTLTGAPAGGDYWSPYVDAAGGFYTSVAGLGNHDVTYTYTNAQGCSSDAVLTINVNSGPSVSFNLGIDSVCSSYGLVALTGGTPGGGTYSGTGVTGTNFDPSVGVGTYNLIYTYTDGSGCTNSDTSVLLVSGCLALEDLSFNDIVLYPNPADEMVNLSISANIDAEMNMNILTVDGKLVQQRMVQVTVGSNLFTINTSTFASGVYFVQLNDGTHTFTRKIVIR
jgi:glucose/arabinose dehydrogenase